jgi:hypothetical protein
MDKSQIKVKFIAILLFLGLSLASFCRNSNDHTICILSIKRSAKNYWEYRTAISIDGVVRPIEVYNCRERLRVRQDGSIVPFELNGPGELICKFFPNS